MRQAPHDTGVIGDPTRTMDIEKSREDPNAIRDNGHREKDLLNKYRDKGEPEYMRQALHDADGVAPARTMDIEKAEKTRMTFGTMDIEKRRRSWGNPRALNRWLNAHGNTWILI